MFEIYESNTDTSAINPSPTIAYSSGQNEPEKDRFLGLAIVSLDEVLQHSSATTSHILQLQGRPYRNDMITGNLTVQVIYN